MGTGRANTRDLGRGKSGTPLRGAIVAMTPDNSLCWKHVIGIDGGLPWHYSGDLKRFKKRTMGCVVIMGRVTWDSIGCKKLPGRRNIVISRAQVPGVEHYDNVEQAINAYPKRRVWIIGGGQIYRAAMPYLNLLDITYVPEFITHRNVVRFPDFDKSCWTGGKRKYKVPGKQNLHYLIFHRIASC